MLTRFHLPLSRQTRQIATKKRTKLSVKMDEETYRMIDNAELKARKHPGKLATRIPVMPDWVTSGLQAVLQDAPISTILVDSKKLADFLHGRHPPAEATTVRAKFMEIKKELAAARNQKIEESGQFDEDEQAKEHKKSIKILKQNIHAWSQVKYNRYTGLLHLIARSPPEYAALHRILQEIKDRDKDFQPKTLMDFGSGLGTVIWATSSIWPNVKREHMCVEASPEMQELGTNILQHANPIVGGIFYRQYIPISNRRYDLVVSAYTLMEMPNMQTRLSNIARLWERTERYLVIVEQGNNAGFKLINEARAFILHMQNTQEEGVSRSHVFSPCPHQIDCPRYKTDDTPCNFEVSYNTFRIKNVSIKRIERYSYVVFKKGDFVDATRNWPRLVRPTLVRSKHSICRMCTADGKLDEIIFTASKHGKWMYRCARSSKWGDRLPAETFVDESLNKEQVDIEEKEPWEVEEENEEETEQREKEFEGIKEENQLEDKELRKEEKKETTSVKSHQDETK